MRSRLGVLVDISCSRKGRTLWTTRWWVPDYNLATVEAGLAARSSDHLFTYSMVSRSLLPEPQPRGVQVLNDTKDLVPHRYRHT